MKWLILYLFVTFLFSFNGISFAQTWENKSPFDADYTGSVNGFFLSENEGWIYKGIRYKSHELFYTNNGAEDFKKIYEFNDSLYSFNSIQMLTSQEGYVTAKWKNSDFPFNDSLFFMKTTDGGISWEHIFDTTFFNQFLYTNLSFHFTNIQTAYTSQVTQEGCAIYKTTDGAISWQKVDIVGFEEFGLNKLAFGGIKKIFFINSNVGWAIGQYEMSEAIVLFTEDSGFTWKIIKYTTDLQDLSFINTNIGGIAGRASHGSIVSITADNFESTIYENSSWTSQNSHFASVITYQNDSTIWISGEPGSIYRSINRGNSFDKFQDYTESEIESVQKINFFKGKYGYLFGVPNKLLKYNDPLANDIDNNIIKHRIRIYPNPTNNYIIINLTYSNSGVVNIYSIAGDLVVSKGYNHKTRIKVELSKLKEGIYLIELYDSKKRYVDKISVY